MGRNLLIPSEILLAAMLLSAFSFAGDSEVKALPSGTYCLVLPAGHKAGVKYPIHIALHGSGDRCANYASWWGNINREKGIILAAPEGKDNRFWQEADVEHIKAVVKDLVDNYGGDTNRALLSGHSAGCSMTFVYMDKFPTEYQMYAGTAHVVQTSVKSLKEAAAKGVQVYYSVGKKDPNYRGYPESVKKLEESGIKFKAEDPDIGHTMTPEQQKTMIEMFVAAADAKTLQQVDAAQKALDAKKTGEAMQILKGLVPADGKGLTPGQAKAKDLLDKLVSAADAAAAEAKKAAEAGRYDEALKNYEKLKADFAGTDYATNAVAAMKTLEADPKVKAFFEELRKQIREQEAEAALQTAAELEKKGDFTKATYQYQTVGEKYASTAAGKKAREALERLAKDPKAVAAEAEREARKMMSKADSYASNQMVDEAREIYQEIVRKFPDTRFAQQAKQKLAKN